MSDLPIPNLTRGAGHGIFGLELAPVVEAIFQHNSGCEGMLERNPRVERFADAPGDLGSWGATIAWLLRR